ncbi:hypothetical protein [Actinomadura sp. 3N508]|uniref:hypothetical protein n=1 Tax=Actinomadura sp. 3N508 TaxID=3375153 RepID=UPI00378D6FCF
MSTITRRALERAQKSLLGLRHKVPIDHVGLDQGGDVVEVDGIDVAIAVGLDDQAAIGAQLLRIGARCRAGGCEAGR